MIRYVTGSIFDSTAQCLVNPINVVGVMGGGLALDFKLRYPDMFATYKKMCNSKELTTGQVAFWAAKKKPDRVICLFPTKDHYINKSTIAILDASFKSFIKYAPIMNIESTAFPMVGCGLGGLDFTLHVRPLMIRYLTELEMDIEVYV